MAGIYVHIPFCKSRCIYCGFYSTVGQQWRQQYVDALRREWQLRSGEVTEHIDTIYLGGGTPSQLSVQQLSRLLEVLPVQGAREVTMECNPDDISAHYAEAQPGLGINRVSLGVQTFSDERLRFLGRRHNARQVATAIDALRQAGIGNISIDLMYGFPGERMDDWLRDIDAALALNVEHLSAYCLMVEEGTVLYERMRNGEEERGERREEKRGAMNEERGVRSEERERQMYEVLIDRLHAAGYEHYELSNFARRRPVPTEGTWRSLHNSSYWHDVPYIGLGAAAHSYRPGMRSWNISNVERYIAAIGRGELPSEQERIDADTHYNDMVTTALRTSDGLSLAALSPRHRAYCLEEAKPFMDGGLLEQHDQQLVLTRQGLFVSDMVMAGLMLV